MVVIRTQLRPDADRALYERVGGEMMPGVVSAKDFAAEDGDQISLVTFESHEALLAWRNLPAHVSAQNLGREQMYASYSIQVCEVTRSYGSP